MKKHDSREKGEQTHHKTKSWRGEQRAETQLSSVVSKAKVDSKVRKFMASQETGEKTSKMRRIEQKSGRYFRGKGNETRQLHDDVTVNRRA
jgi:hypothetical protein